MEFTVHIEKDGVPIWWDTFVIVVADTPTALPDNFALLRNFPNPFNAETQIVYRLPQEARVRLTVFNAIGQPVRQLVNATQAAGTHRVTWDGQDDRGSPVATGIYFYRFAAGPLPSSAADGSTQIALNRLTVLGPHAYLEEGISTIHFGEEIP